MTVDRETLDRDAYVLRALADVRISNAIVVAWVRICLRVLTLGVFSAVFAGWGRSITVLPVVGIVLSALHLAIGAAVLQGLRRRHSQLWVVLGAVTDLCILATSAALAVRRGEQDPLVILLLFASAGQLLLLFAALTVERRVLRLLAAATTAWVCSLAFHAGANAGDTLLVLALFGGFAFTLSMAGARIVELAARAAAEAWMARAERQHAEALSAANAGLRAAQAEAETLSQLVVHDLRNPLATVTLSLGVIAEALSPDDVEARESADIARRELRRVVELSNDLLVISRLEARRTEAPAAVDLDALLLDVEGAGRPVAARGGAGLNCTRDPAVPRDVVLDAALVRRMLDNLVANASRHVRPSDRIEVAVERDADALRFAVRNTGPAVIPEIRDRLFEKGATAGKRQFHNAGLGLYLCRLVAERHGGTIALVTRPGWDVSFEATFPLVRPPPAEQSAPRSPRDE